MLNKADSINLDDFFESTDYGSMGRPCLDPKDVAEVEKMNKEMEKVHRDLIHRFALSEQFSRGLWFRQRVRN